MGQAKTESPNRSSRPPSSGLQCDERRSVISGQSSFLAFPILVVVPDSQLVAAQVARQQRTVDPNDLKAFCRALHKPKRCKDSALDRLFTFSKLQTLPSWDEDYVGWTLPFVWLANNGVYVDADGGQLALRCSACAASFDLTAFLRWLGNSEHVPHRPFRLSSHRVFTLLPIITHLMHDGLAQSQACPHKPSPSPRASSDEMDHRNENSAAAVLPQNSSNSTRSDRTTRQTLQTSKYSSGVKLVYFLSPNSNTILVESYADVRVRQREARFSRNLNDPNEREPYAHRTLIARYNSFFDDPAQPTAFTRWARSLNLALLLAHHGFYLVPKSQQSPKHDKIRCTYCKRGKYGWFAWSYPETTRSAACRPSDTEIANALLKWHRIKSPTCPAILDLDVDGEFSSSANTVVTNNDNINVVTASLCPVSDEEQPEESFNVSETAWQSHTNDTVSFTPAVPSYCSRTQAIFATQPRFSDFWSEDMRVWTFLRGSQVITYEKYVNTCLENTNLELGNDRWPQTAPSAQRMASAGFIATLRADEVYCYYCGGALSDWQVSDDPLAEHAFHFPSCPFILNNCGARFVERVRARASRPMYSPVLGPVERGAIHRRVEPRDVRCRPEVSLERTIAEELKLDLLLYSHAIETALREEGDYKDAFELLDVIRELEALRRQLRLDLREFVRRRNEEYDQLLRGTHVLLNRAPEQQEGGEQHEEEPANRAATCAVCLENPLQLAFVPCGHLCTCFSCGSRLDTCPICRQQIRGVIRVYI